LWLIPPTLGTKIMQAGQTAAMICASCPAPLGSRLKTRTSRGGIWWSTGCARSSVRHQGAKEFAATVTAEQADAARKICADARAHRSA
jgi:hypothetical protein